MQSYNRSSIYITFQTLLNIASVMFAGIFLHSNIFAQLHTPNPHITHAIHSRRTSSHLWPTCVFYWCSVLAMDIRITYRPSDNPWLQNSRVRLDCLLVPLPCHRRSVNCGSTFPRLITTAVSLHSNKWHHTGKSADNFVINTLDSKWDAQKLIWSNINLALAFLDHT
jgi:hypothetical protein